jgi:hypothetical protein
MARKWRIMAPPANYQLAVKSSSIRALLRRSNFRGLQSKPQQCPNVIRRSE